MSADEARQELASFLKLVASDLDDSEIEPEARAMRMASRYEKTEDGLAPLIVRARSEPFAYDACCAVLDYLIQRDMPIPANLALMARDVMMGKQQRPTRRGRDAMKSFGRDGVIVTCVGLATMHGLPLYSHGESKAPTACEVTASVLKDHGVHLSPDAVEAVWEKMNGGKK
jgi:hypothetical protein